MGKRPLEETQSYWSDSLGKKLFDGIVEGKSIKTIVAEGVGEKISHRTIMKWATDPDHPFYPIYHQAREIALWGQVDEYNDLVNSTTPDNHQVNKTKIAALQWMLERRLNEKFGAKKEVKHSGSVNAVSSTSNRDLARLLGALAYETGTPIPLVAEEIDDEGSHNSSEGKSKELVPKPSQNK